MSDVPASQGKLMWELGCATGTACVLANAGDALASDLATVLIAVSAAYHTGDRAFMASVLEVAHQWPSDLAERER